MKPLIHLSLAALLTMPAFAAVAAGKGVGVMDLGKDGDIRYYEIRCVNGRTLSLEADYEKKESCFSLSKTEQSCLKTLDIRRAGEQACAATAP
jgi:hypothetical protein